MFKHIMIHLRGPLCSCEEKNLSWAIKLFDDKYGLRVYCKSCDVSLDIPHGSFKAGFELDTPYPGKTPEKPKLESIQGGKVIPLPKDGGSDV